MMSLFFYIALISPNYRTLVSSAQSISPEITLLCYAGSVQNLQRTFMFYAVCSISKLKYDVQLNSVNISRLKYTDLSCNVHIPRLKYQLSCLCCVNISI
jgi:hypothetical protein